MGHMQNEVVVGSSDHALYVIDAEKGTKKRQLYNKSSGHSDLEARACFVALGGPISQLCYDSHTGMVVSASYDKTVRMWQCGSRGEQRVVLTGHEAPVMELGISTIDGKMITAHTRILSYYHLLELLLVLVLVLPLVLVLVLVLPLVVAGPTGDRSGHVILWDTTASDVSWRLRGVHTGQVSALAWCDAEDPDLSGFFISGGQDGHVRVWDPREKKNPKRIMLHVTKEGKGGVAAANKVVTCGADMTLRVLEPRKGFALMSTLRLTDYPYSMAVAGMCP
ncbi:hypothetical protein QJQ45_012034 [Haematococcus lacustris]|nr:hypothetical protein QJQ45_012034 [Haematococcus lacustris]